MFILDLSSFLVLQLWDMVSGQLIKTLVYQESVHSVIMDGEEKHLFAGLEGGAIWSTPLYSQVRSMAILCTCCYLFYTFLFVVVYFNCDDG